MKRTPEEADAKVLAYAGVLGHRYVWTTSDGKGGRRTEIECSEIRESDREELKDREPRAFEQIRYRSRKGRRWRRVR